MRTASSTAIATATVNGYVDHHFSIVEEAERSILKSVARANRLRASILKLAVEGKLVSQDPHDEPASILLETTKAEQQPFTLDGQAPASSRRRRKASR